MKPPTPTQIVLLQHVANGLSTGQASVVMQIGITTAKTHLHEAYGRLGAYDKAHAVAEAMRRGLIR